MLVCCIHAGSGLTSPECLDKCSNKSGRTAIAKTGQGDHGPAEAFELAMQSAAASIKALNDLNCLTSVPFACPSLPYNWQSQQTIFILQPADF